MKQTDSLRYSPAVTETAAIVFERVSVARGGRPILNGVDLTLERGETVALVGRSGAGKSTILKLVNRLLCPTPGACCVGRADHASGIRSSCAATSATSSRRSGSFRT